jgi:hypothetical protein
MCILYAFASEFLLQYLFPPKKNYGIIAIVLQAQGMLHEAPEMNQKALNIFETSLDSRHASVADTYLKTASVEQQLGNSLV